MGIAKKFRKRIQRYGRAVATIERAREVREIGKKPEAERLFARAEYLAKIARRAPR